MTSSMIWFFILATISILSAIGMIASRNPVRSALLLVTNFFVLALFYLMLSAQFIAMVQIIVYAGAIMVLFLFVIMLLNIGGPDSMNEKGGLQPVVAGVAAVFFLGTLAGAGALSKGMPKSMATNDTIKFGGTAETIGRNLFDGSQPWLFPFEITSILLLVGIIGSIVLAKRKL